jgi:hypothetical protein
VDLEGWSRCIIGDRLETYPCPEIIMEIRGPIMEFGGESVGSGGSAYQEEER